MVRKFRKRVIGLITLNKLIYLISPNEINNNFYKTLDKVLSYGNVKFFQLRLKKKGKKNIIKIGKKIRKITLKYKVKFIINDDFTLVPKVKADGCHMGQSDGLIRTAKKSLIIKFWALHVIIQLRLQRRQLNTKQIILLLDLFLNLNLSQMQLKQI